MKIRVPGDTPMERLTNLTKRIVAVPKDELSTVEKHWRKSRRRKKRRITP
jgi:hypothetical protein